MSIIRIFLIINLMFQSYNCSSVASINPELRRKAANIEILTKEEIKSREYEIIGEVLGVSGARQAGANPDMEAAREKLKIEAAKLNADAVINVICEEGGIDLKRNYWKTIQCRGDAIKWKSAKNVSNEK